jgi:acetyl/propionyl-CoA carboxylase alpha subunit
MAASYLSDSAEREVREEAEDFRLLPVAAAGGGGGGMRLASLKIRES